MSSFLKFLPCDDQHLGRLEPLTKEIVTEWKERGVHVALAARPDGSPFVHSIIFRGRPCDDLDACNAALIPDLRALAFDGTKISDNGMREIAKLPNLESLDLTDTSISDVGIKFLQHAPALEFLHVEGTRVTPVGLRFLQSRRNRIEICSDFH